MARPKQTVPSTFLNIALPQSIADRLAIELYSEVEGRIPVGAYKAFFTGLLEQYFEQCRNPCPKCNGTGVKGVV